MKDGKHVVLCIDDDPDVLVVLRTILESAGYAMAEAPSAEEGLAVFKQEQPDLVIVDLMMEEVDAGKTLVQEIKALQGEVPIYMLSSVGDSLSQHVDFQELGLLGVFQKPIDPETLLATIKAKLN
ncbi:MAG: response regulator [Candidatus Lernaella stagnicola]|nr:response regulator [Candidatus Lernaella stagnicola]